MTARETQLNSPIAAAKNARILKNFDMTTELPPFDAGRLSSSKMKVDLSATIGSILRYDRNPNVTSNVQTNQSMRSGSEDSKSYIDHR